MESYLYASVHLLALCLRKKNKDTKRMNEKMLVSWFIFGTFSSAWVI
jgi:hypothetical protein